MKNLGTFLVLFCVLLAFNVIFPAQSDDIGHFYAANSGADFFTTYFTWNGRLGEILYTGFFAKLNNSFWLNTLNALVGSAFIFACFALIFARLPQSRVDFYSFLLLCILLISVNDFASTFLWYSGSFNYLWGIFFIVIFLLPVRFWIASLFANTPPRTPHILALLSYSILAIMAGMSSEHMGALVSLGLVSLFALCLYKRIKIPAWLLMGGICFIAGWIMLYLSPGSRYRAQIQEQAGIFINLSTFLKMYLTEQMLWLNNSLNNLYNKGFVVFFILFSSFITYRLKLQKRYYILIALFVIFGIVFTRHIAGIVVYGAILLGLIYLAKQIDKKYYFCALLFGAWILVGLITFQITYGLPTRARLGDNLLLFTLILLFFRDFYKTYNKQILLERSLIAILALSTALCFANWAWVGYKWHKLQESVATQKANGIQDIVVSKEVFKSYCKTNWDLPQNDANFYVNQNYARYFGIKSFRVE